MAAIAEFARRAGAGPHGQFAADELAFELHMTQQSVAGQMDFAADVARRLPRTFAALAAGLIHPVHLKIIEEETRILTDADAARADAFLAAAAPGMTYGELRYAARKVVLKLDPDAVKKRKQAARREAHVRRFQEESGNAGMVARELPSDEVLASWQHVEQRPWTCAPPPLTSPLQASRPQAATRLARPVPDLTARRKRRPGRERRPGRKRRPGWSRPRAPSRRGCRPEPGRPGHITIPLTTYQGRSDIPGDACGFGILDGDDARDLAAAAARHPRTRWCITALNPDGTAAAHACLPGRHPPSAPYHPAPGPSASWPPR